MNSRLCIGVLAASIAANTFAKNPFLEQLSSGVRHLRINVVYDYVHKESYLYDIVSWYAYNYLPCAIKESKQALIKNQKEQIAQWNDTQMKLRVLRNQLEDSEAHIKLINKTSRDSKELLQIERRKTSLQLAHGIMHAHSTTLKKPQPLATLMYDETIKKYKKLKVDTESLLKTMVCDPLRRLERRAYCADNSIQDPFRGKIELTNKHIEKEIQRLLSQENFDHASAPNTFSLFGDNRQSLTEVLQEIAEWLKNKPYEVIFITLTMPPEGTILESIANSSMSTLLFTPNTAAFGLNDMAQSGKQVALFVEGFSDPAYPWALSRLFKGL